MNEIIAREVRVQQFNPWPRNTEEKRQREWEKEGTRRDRRYIPSSPEHGWRRGAAGGFHSLSSHQRSCCSPYGIWPFLTNRPLIHSQHALSSSWNKVVSIFYAVRTLDGHEGSKSVFDSHSIETSKLEAFIQMCIHTGFRVRSFLFYRNPCLKARNMHSGHC